MVRFNLIKSIEVSGVVALAVFLLAGCAATDKNAVHVPVDPAVVSTGDPAAAAPGPVSAVAPAPAALGTFGIGDLVIVGFSGLSDTNLQPHEERIKEDGTITLPQIGSVRAAGKTTGELQKEIRSRYVDGKIYKSDLNVTVKAQERYFYVSGEVNRASSYMWAEGMTVLKAIASAGGFNDFADRTKVIITRADGRQVTVNCKKAQRDPTLDLPVYPSDSVFVSRTLF